MKAFISIVILLFSQAVCFSQEKDTLTKKLDSLATLPDSNNIAQERYNEATRISGRTYLTLLGNNFKQQATAPFHLKGNDWVKVAGFGAAVGTVMLTEKKIQVFAREFTARNSGVGSVSNFVTEFGATYELYTLAALGEYGFIFKNRKMQTTTLLASQAFITSYAWFNVAKFISQKQRPNYTDPATGDPAPKFHGPFYRFKKVNGKSPDDNSYTSFPSGHASLVFAAATVYAMEYRDRPIIPILAYGTATLVGLTRITENRHWASDILVGAALGHLCGRQVVNNYHRYARLKQSGRLKKKNTITFNLHYMNGQLLPGLVYRFN